MVYLCVQALNKEKPKFMASLPLIMFLLVSLVSNTFKSYNITYIILLSQILFSDCKTKSQEIENKTPNNAVNQTNQQL